MEGRRSKSLMGGGQGCSETSRVLMEERSSPSWRERAMPCSETGVLMEERSILLTRMEGMGE